MGKITAAQLEVATEWMAFGKRLGWNIVSCSEDSGVFHLRSGTRINVLMEARQDIETTWREQDKPKLEVANG